MKNLIQNVKRRISKKLSFSSDRSASRRSEGEVDPSLLVELVEETGGRLSEKVCVMDQRLSRTGSATIWLKGDRTYVAKLSLRDLAEPRLQHNGVVLADLTRAPWIDAALLQKIPRIILTGRISGKFYLLESALPGEEGTKFIDSPERLQRVISEAVRFLIGLHGLSKKEVVLSPTIWDERFRPMIEQVGELVADAGCGPIYAEIVHYLQESLVDRKIPLVFGHGNFWLGNVLFDTHFGLTGVIDWDAAEELELPLTDLLYLLIRTESLQQDMSYGQAVIHWIRSDFRSVRAMACIETYGRQLCSTISAVDVIKALSYYSWIQSVYLHVRYRTPTSTNPVWIKRNMIHVLREAGRDF